MVDTEYITKESALACFSDWIDRYGHEHTADEMVEYQKIEDLPEEDVRPVVKGEWIPTCMYDYYYKCSACGEIGPLEPQGEGVFRFNFCPNCGADMREAETDG